jgi:hypothetical protein
LVEISVDKSSHQRQIQTSSFQFLFDNQTKQKPQTNVKMEDNHQSARQPEGDDDMIADVLEFIAACPDLLARAHSLHQDDKLFLVRAPPPPTLVVACRTWT